MRTPKTITQLANDAAKGTLYKTEVLRDIVNSSEMNQLRLLDSHLDDLEAIIRSPDKSTGMSPNEETILELNAAAADPAEFGEGYIVEDETKYRQLKKYIDVLNVGKPKEDRYHLGHETGVYTYYLKIVRENYNPDITNKSPTDKAIIKRQKALLDNALRASIFIDSLNKADIIKLKAAGLGSGLSTKDLKLVLNSAGRAINLDIEVQKHTTKLFKSGQAKITLTAEMGTDNELTGFLTNALSTMVKTSFGSGKVKGNPIDQLLRELDPTNIEGSPAIIDSIGNYLFNTAKGIKKKFRGKKSRVTKSEKIRANNQASVRLKRRINKRLVKLQGYLKTKRQKKKYIVPTVSLKALINESLAEWIRLRMAASSAPASLSYLRNQTGRFSESARLLTLNRVEAGALIGTYGFQRDPYGTFLPGGRLHTQQRDPKLYIEGAIRDIAAKVLKRQFKGIALELQ